MKKKLFVAAGLLLLGLAAYSPFRTFAQDQAQRFERSIELVAEDSYIWLGKNVSIWFEGDVTDTSQTNLVAAEPTADRTITLPDMTGTVTVGTAAIKIARGYTTASGANPFSITTGLATLVACSVMHDQTTITGEGTAFFSTQLTDTAGQLDVYRWNTPGDAVTDARLIRWYCVGT